MDMEGIKIVSIDNYKILLVELTKEEQDICENIVGIILSSNNLYEVMKAWETACNTNQRVVISVHRCSREVIANIILGKDPRFTNMDLYEYIDSARITSK